MRDSKRHSWSIIDMMPLQKKHIIKVEVDNVNCGSKVNLSDIQDVVHKCPFGDIILKQHLINRLISFPIAKMF